MLCVMSNLIEWRFLFFRKDCYVINKLELFNKKSLEEVYSSSSLGL